MYKMKLCLLVVFCLSVAKPVAAQSVNDSEVVNKIEHYLSNAESKGFSGYILVSKKGKTILSKGYGTADREKNIKNTAQTVFDIGSNTKQFTSAAILTLVEQKKLKLDDTLGQLFIDVSDVKKPVTVHQLLTHTAGFEEYSGRSFNQASKKEFLKNVLQTPLIFQPGEKYEYSNAGYSVLAAIIEQVSGLGYEEYLDKYLFKPAGMNQTGYLLPQWEPENIATGYYRGYRNVGNIVGRYKEDGVSWNLIGNGGIQSTAVDLELWFKAIKSGKVLAKDSIDVMLEPQVEHSAKNWFYAYGWMIKEQDGHPRIVAHTGSNNVYWSSLYWIPSENITVIFSTNAELDEITSIGARVRNMLLDAEYNPAPVARNINMEINRFSDNNSSDNVSELWAKLAQLDLKLDNSNILNGLGSWYLSQSKSDWALVLLKKNTELFPEDGNLLDSLGEAYLAVGNKEYALESFKKALVKAPEKGCGWCSNSEEKIKALNKTSNK